MAPRLELGFVCQRCNVLSPMAEVLAREMGGDGVTVASAGLEPAGRILPSALTALREVGMDTTELVPTEVDRAWLEACDRVVLVGLEASDDPLFEGLDPIVWEIESPDSGQLGEVRRVRDELGVRVRQLLRDRGIEVDEPDAGPAETLG